jgi:molybdopterin/thiamine biosynthesis adenylyltransferase
MGRLMGVDTIRHQGVFDPVVFGERRIDVIGAGAIGSRIVMGLAKLGLQNIHVWDFDEVEPHNIANQIFGNDDVGKMKVAALAELVKRQTGTYIVCHPERYVTGCEALGNVVFLATDTMASRKEIWEASIRFKTTVECMVEARMGADNGRLYTVVPAMIEHVRLWEATLYTDAEAEVSVCGTSVTVGATADVISGLAVWQMIRWFDSARSDAEAPEVELIFGLKPLMVV